MPGSLQAALDAMGHEQVTICRDPESGYVGVFAVHSSLLGPAVGGTRIRRYADLGEAMEDALRLSRGMTYKNALAGLPFGGGKAVILGPAPESPAARARLFRAHGRFVDRLGGLFITAEDVGTNSDDMEIIAQETPHVAGRASGMGDPSPFTAFGVLRAMEAVAHERWGSSDVAGRSVAIQGLGHVGMHLTQSLAERGAHLIVTDVEPALVRNAVDRLGAVAVAPDDILDADADIFAPCALGGILDREGVERLRVQAVCGAANNQLADAAEGDRLHERGIRYVPDYVANAGGVISGSVDIAGWDRARMDATLDGIFATVGGVFAAADRLGVAPHVAADRLAEERLREAGAAFRA